MKKIQLLVLSIISFSLLACSSQQNLQVSQLIVHSIGIAPLDQPIETIELMAGYYPESRKLADNAQLARIDNIIKSELSHSSYNIQHLEKIEYNDLLPQIEGNQTKGILAYWIEYGKKHNVELLLVPQLLYISEKSSESAEASINNKNALMLDFFLIDTREQGLLLKRAHFAEEEQIKNSEINGMKSFSERMGSAELEIMVQDATKKMIEEFSL